MKIYSGYCRGGPWDGKQFVHHKSYFEIYVYDGENMPVALEPGADNRLVETSVKIITYGWVDGEWRAPK